MTSYREVMPTRKPYPSDLTDLQWQNIEHLFGRPRQGQGGRPRTDPVRESAPWRRNWAISPEEES